MAYFNSKVVNYSFDEAENRIKDILQKEGFGVLTEINVKDTLKKMLDIDFRNYKIFGACIPSLAYKALLMEENIGVLLPCNVILQEKHDGTIHVSVVNPLESIQAVKNSALAELVSEVSKKLERFLATL